jgi:hypothetical protein
MLFCDNDETTAPLLTTTSDASIPANVTDVGVVAVIASVSVFVYEIVIVDVGFFRR